MFAANEADLKELIGIENGDGYYVTQITSTGTGGNEAVLLALEGLGRGLIVNNGFFGDRVVDQAVQNGIDHLMLQLPSDCPIDVSRVEATLDANPDIKWVFFVSHETRMGMRNPFEQLGQMCKARGLMVGADIVSSAYAYPIDIEASQVDLAVASSAKALQAAPGIAMIFVKLASLEALTEAGPSKGYYMDVVAETKRQQAGDETRFAQPVVLHASIRAACMHMKEVGIDNHMARIQTQMQSVIDHLHSLGIEPMLDAAYRSNIAVNFRLPEGMPYSAFAPRMQAEGYYLLYGIPGDDTHFQLSTIGDLSDDHVAGLNAAFTKIFS
jgi:2-aminoethylphosphonate-pyruvate transaminase